MMWLDRLPVRRVTSGFLWGLAAAHVIETLGLRKRRQQLPALLLVESGQRLVVHAAAVPALVVSKAADEAKNAVLHRTDRPGNPYRIVARKT